jgi:hypothetical protein
MPSQRFHHFETDIARARDLVGLGQSIGGLTHGRVDASDLFRAALAQAVAALDAYVHGVTLDRGVDILLGNLKSIVPVSTRVGLDLNAVLYLLSARTPVDRELAIRSQLAQRLARETFQRPDDIGRALAMVGIPKVWSSACAQPDKVKLSLGLIVSRRNQIVHSCDVDPMNPGTVTQLSDGDALDAIDTVENIVAGIDDLL